MTNSPIAAQEAAIVMLQAMIDVRPMLSARQLRILFGLCMPPPEEYASHKIRTLAVICGVSKPAVTRALDVLVAHRFAVRKKSENDGRDVDVSITHAGRRYTESLIQQSRP